MKNLRTVLIAAVASWVFTAQAAEPDVCALVTPELIKQTLGLDTRMRGPMAGATNGCVFNGAVRKGDVRVAVQVRNNANMYAPAPGAKIVDGAGYKAYYTAPDQSAQAAGGVLKGTLSVYVGLDTRQNYTGEQFQAFLKALADKL